MEREASDIVNRLYDQQAPNPIVGVDVTAFGVPDPDPASVAECPTPHNAMKTAAKTAPARPGGTEGWTDTRASLETSGPSWSLKSL